MIHKKGKRPILLLVDRKGRLGHLKLPFTISPLLSLLFLLYSSFFRFLLGLSSFGSVFTKTREKGRDKAPQERKNMREKAVLRN
jgi:hypothetical protein